MRRLRKMTPEEVSREVLSEAGFLAVADVSPYDERIRTVRLGPLVPCEDGTASRELPAITRVDRGDGTAFWLWEWEDGEEPTALPVTNTNQGAGDAGPRRV